MSVASEMHGADRCVCIMLRRGREWRRPRPDPREAFVVHLFSTRSTERMRHP